MMDNSGLQQQIVACTLEARCAVAQREISLLGQPIERAPPRGASSAMAARVRQRARCSRTASTGSQVIPRAGQVAANIGMRRKPERRLARSHLHRDRSGARVLRSTRIRFGSTPVGQDLLDQRPLHRGSPSAWASNCRKAAGKFGKRPRQ